MKNILGKQVSALKLGIECLERERREKFSVGDAAYRQGMRTDKIAGDGISGNGFQWVEEDHKAYVRYSEAIRELGDMIEVLEDPGVTVCRQEDLPCMTDTSPSKNRTSWR